jgi:hypothetical protein
MLEAGQATRGRRFVVWVLALRAGPRAKHRASMAAGPQRIGSWSPARCAGYSALTCTRSLPS